MISESQIKNAKKVQVVSVEETPRRIYIFLVYIDSEGRHEHTVDWDRSIVPSEENILDALWCTCTNCSYYSIISKKMCIFKIRAIKELITRGFWDASLWNIVKRDV